MAVLHTLWWCFSFFICAHTIPKYLLYEFNHDQAIKLPKENDISSPEVHLNVPIVFYGISYRTIFVNSNGLLSFQTEIANFFNIEFPLDYPLIAAFYSNVDTRGAGTISYYETDNIDLIQRAAENIHEAFSSSQNFLPTSLFIVTWDEVGYYNNGTDKLNTYQVVISSDGTDSYVELLYPQDGIQWIQGTGDESGLPDARAQAGFVAADGRYHILPGSGSEQVKNLEKWTNINLPGQWLFRIGLIPNEVNIEEPDLNNEGFSATEKTCEKAASIECHARATCTDYEEGFCCACKKDYYGNGKFCIQKNIPLRVNGKVNGKINGERLENLDLQSYIVMSDARAYTAISKIPESIGFDIQSLQILGGVIGWLFAKPISDALNGYQLTGGVFNHTANIVFANTSQKITIRQKYLGLDVFDQLRLETNIEGELPHLPIDSKIQISEYQEQYTLTAPGVIQSTATHSYRFHDIDGNEKVHIFTVDQNFLFDYCKYKTLTPGLTWRLKVGRNYIEYESREQIIRFGLSNKVGPLGDIDPCEEGRSSCGANSACVVENDSYRCICNPGYQHIYQDNQAYCVDINECQTGTHDCDYNAQCINEVGSYSCKCNPGFEGNGHICQNALNCQNIQCPENAECVENGVAICRCLPGFTGNGQYCTPIIDHSCHKANNCSPYGICTINSATNEYYCACLPGYEGDGYTCNQQEIRTTESNWEKQECPEGYEMDEQSRYCIPKYTGGDVVSSTSYPERTTYPEHELERPEVQCYNTTLCFCPTPYYYIKSSNSCTIIQGSKLETKGFSGFNISCDVLNNCHKDAQCLYSSTDGNYQCVCNSGYEGNGYDCYVAEVSCAQLDNCNPHATCTYNETKGRSICVCDPGYEGDGYNCKITAICSTNSDCPENEECLYIGSTRRYECVCKEGLVKDSQHQCVKLSGTCGGGTCVENAECLYDDEYQTFYCTCKSDYIGDGITECKPRPVGCNVINNCGLHANCEYDSQSSIYQCKCAEGFYGDGFICYTEKNCHIDPSLCDMHATCVTNAERRYICECNIGYTGNGTVCKQNPRHDGNFLLLNQGMATLRIPFEESKKNLGRPIQIKYYQTAVGLDIDCFEGKVYWSDVNGRAIRSASYNGSNLADFITGDIGSPEGVSVDWVSRNIYWTDSTKDTIEVANLETKLRKVLFDTNLVNPRGIAVHPQRGKIFWSDWDRKGPKIEWANGDGTGREIFLQGESVKLPNSLVIDFETEKLCYTDAGTKNIECVDIDTKEMQTIAVNCTYPFGIAVTDRNIYWSDWISKKIERVDKNSLQRLSPLQVPLGGSGNKLYGLAAVPESCPYLTNVCQYYKDQCPSGYICLPNGSGSRRCVCGYKADSPLEKPTCNDV